MYYWVHVTYILLGTCNMSVPILLNSIHAASVYGDWSLRRDADVFVNCFQIQTGLTCHPEQPFLLASSSRDSTLRLWSLMPLLQPLELSILADMPPADVFSTPGELLQTHTYIDTT